MCKMAPITYIYFNKWLNGLFVDSFSLKAFVVTVCHLILTFIWRPLEGNNTVSLVL